MSADVTVCIPTIPPRRTLLDRALRSVWAQTVPIRSVAIACDTDHDGAWSTRNRALSMSTTEWTVFLDDDDELLPHYVESMLAFAERESADVVWGWFTVAGGGTDPFPHYRGRQFDPLNPHIVPITYMARTRLLHAALDDGGFGADTIGAWDVQDLPVLRRMHDDGAVLRASDEIVWKWWHHGANTSGLPSRWK